MLESTGSQGVRHSLREQQMCLMKDRFLSALENFAIPWACQAPLSMEFSRQEYWSELPCFSPGDLPYPRIGSHIAGRFFYHLNHRGSPIFYYLNTFFPRYEPDHGSQGFFQMVSKSHSNSLFLLTNFQMPSWNMFQASPINLSWLTVGTLSVEHKEIPICSEDM